MSTHLSERQKESVRMAKMVPVGLRTYTQLNEARGIVGSTPAEQCEAARRINEKQRRHDDP